MKVIKKFLAGLLVLTAIAAPVSAAGIPGVSIQSTNAEFCPNCKTYTVITTCSGTTYDTVTYKKCPAGHSGCTKKVRRKYDLHGCTECTYHYLEGYHGYIERHENSAGTATEMMSICPYWKY